MKKLIFSFFLVFTFMFCIFSVSAATSIEITCGSDICKTSTFQVAQLSSVNTGLGQSYSAYASYFDSADHKPFYTYFKTGTSTYNSLVDGFSWSSVWSSSAGFSTYKTFFNSIEFSRTGYSGTFVYLIRQIETSTTPYIDGSEYIVYVTVNTAYSITSITAKQIKDVTGASITPVTVSELSFESVSNTIEITCGSSKCETSDFKLVQLTGQNTGYSGTYGNYSAYFDSSKHLSYATYYSTNLLSNGYTWTSTWSSSSGFTTLKTVFNSLNYSYTGYYGTYAYLLQQVPTTSNSNIDLSEYIVYVTTNSNKSVVAIHAKKIKDSTGALITAETVSELTFSSNVMDLSNAVFYLSNQITGDYANLDSMVYYRVRTSLYDNITAYIYDSSGEPVRSLTLGTSITTISLANGQHLVVYNTDNWNFTFNVSVYSGLESYGYVPTYTAMNNGSSTTSLNIAPGGSGPSYVKYTWNYPNSNVPATGIDLNIVPYIVMGVMSLLVGFYVVTSRRRKTSFDYEE